jgi:hypothetical protein
MTTVDKLLLKIVNHNSPTIEEILAKRDSRVLRSLATSISSNMFITENQSKLLLKILDENCEKFEIFKDEISETIKAPMWSQRFRFIEQVRKFYIGKDLEHEPCLILEFTFSSQIRKILQNLAKNLENLTQRNPGKSYEAELTEHNIVVLFEALNKLNFDIDETIKTHYETIKSWSKTDFSNQFLITSMTNQNFLKHITADLGVETSVESLIINDRSKRYQYFLKNDENAKNDEKSLISTIANRPHTRVWIDKNTHSLIKILDTLVELKRLPLLIVFDSRDEQKNQKNLNLLSDALEICGLDHDVGIYFRLPNTDSGVKFNQLIGEKKYNAPLDNKTQIVGVQSGKIPKFFLSNTWRPMSVIVLDNVMGMRHGKTAIYANCCDLILEYSDTAPIVEKHFIS